MKYNAKTFCNTNLELDRTVPDFYNSPVTKLELLALAIAAQKINGEYCKREGKSDFVDEVTEDGETISRYVKIKESNRFVMETLQAVDNSVITPELLAEAQDMLSGLEMDYMFKVLGDSLNEFENSIQQFLSVNETDMNVRHQIGIVAYIPAYVEREAKQREMAERSIDSNYLGNCGDVINADIEIISKRQATAWAGWNVNAITTEGNRISFFTTKDDISNMKGVFKISAKVKDHGRVWRDESIKETRLNYVKLT
jgi:hypothetical protein